MYIRIQGLPHSSVEEAEHPRVRELIYRIENHPHRDDLQANLMQDNVYNPCSEKFAENDPRHGESEILRIVRHHFKSTVLLLSTISDKRHCVPHLWKLLAQHDSTR